MEWDKMDDSCDDDSNDKIIDIYNDDCIIIEFI